MRLLKHWKNLEKKWLFQEQIRSDQIEVKSVANAVVAVVAAAVATANVFYFILKFVYQISKWELSETHNFGIFNCILINFLRVFMMLTKNTRAKKGHPTNQPNNFETSFFIFWLCVFFFWSNSNLCSYKRANEDRESEW